VLRLQRDAQPVLALPVPSTRAAVLVVTPRNGQEPSLALLQHVATIVALEAEKLTAEREHRRRIGSELLAAIIDGRVDGAVAASQLESHGLRPDALVVAALERSGPMRSDMHSRLGDRGVPHVLLRRGETLLIVLDAEGESVERLLSLAGHDAYVGLSSRPVLGAGRIPDAVREARLSLQAARSGDRRVVPYGTNDRPFMPRTVAEAAAIVDRILGPLIEYDREHNANLVHSLAQFLRANRSWQRAAEPLFVHKQTLVYRMKRVEELTGRHLDDTGDVAELWLALQALEITA
jgi:purine catabolism regulator